MIGKSAVKSSPGGSLVRVGALAKALQGIRLSIALPLATLLSKVHRRSAGTIVKVAQNKNGQLQNWHKLILVYTLAISIPFPVSPSEEPKITRLPRNGPKPGQSMQDWLYGKDRHEQREMERLRWQLVKGKKKTP